MKCTHVALQVHNIDPSAAFYARYCGMNIVQDRRKDDGRVVWLGWGEDPPGFVIVLIEEDYDANHQPRWQHLGMSVESREEVDAVYRRAVRDGLVDLWKPTDAGEIVGYYCALMDPDGNRVEFSFGQRIG